MSLKIILMNEQILTIHNIPYEDDAFLFDHKYLPEEIVFNLPIQDKEMGDKHAIKTNRSKTIT